MKQPSYRPAQRRHPVRRRKLKKPGRFFLILLCLAGLPALAWWFLQPAGPAGAPVQAAPAPPVGRIAFLLVGADEREGDVGRSDTMILAAVDFDQKQAELFSLSRDMFVNIPGHGWDKLNSAYAYGGLDLTRQTLEKTLGVPLPHYVLVNMQGLQEAVDTVDGIQVNVEHDMHYEDPHDTPPLKINLRAGPQTLDGTKALHYARFRADAEADRGRMRRQQEVVRALARAAIKPGNLTRLPALISTLLGSVKTDLSAAEVGRLGLAGAQIDPGTIKGGQVEGEDVYMDGIYYFQPDLLDLRTRVFRLVQGREPDADFLVQARKDAAAFAAVVAQHADPPAPPPAAPAPPPKPGTTAPAPAPPPKPGTTAPAPAPPPKPGTTAPAPAPPPKPGTTAPAPAPPPKPGGTSTGPGSSKA